MGRVFLTSNFRTTLLADALSQIETVFQQLEDQINAGTAVVSLDAVNRKLPQGMRNGDVVFDLQSGELRIGIYNGASVQYVSFGSFLGTITDAQHGNRAGGSLHPEAVGTTAGFITLSEPHTFTANQVFSTLDVQDVATFLNGTVAIDQLPGAPWVALNLQKDVTVNGTIIVSSDSSDDTTYINAFSPNASFSFQANDVGDELARIQPTGIHTQYQLNVGCNDAIDTAKIKGSGTGYVSLGQMAGYTDAGVITLNAASSIGGYNFAADNSLELLINRPTGKNIYFRCNNVDQMSLSPTGQLKMTPTVGYSPLKLYIGSPSTTGDDKWQNYFEHGNTGGGYRHYCANYVMNVGANNAYTGNLASFGLNVNGTVSGNNVTGSVGGFTASLVCGGNASTLMSNGYTAFLKTPFFYGGAKATNIYGFYVQAQKTADVTNAYALYCEGASDISYINGLLGLGTNAPTEALTFADARNIKTGTTTGTKIGTATTQKLGFWDVTPIVQPTTGVAAATFVANTSAIVDDTATFDGYTIGQVVKALRNEGLLA